MSRIINALAGAVAVVFLLAFGNANAQNFNVPKECGTEVSGIDPLYTDLPPVASVLYNDGNSELPGRVFQDTRTKNWFVELNITNAFPTYLIVATYTPFLQSYAAVNFPSMGVYNQQLPAAGVYYNPQYKLYPKVTLPITTTLTSKTPMPGAFVELAPDFPGSSPYTVEADENGNVILYCFTALPSGNDVTVFTPDHDFAYTATYTFNSKDEEPEHGLGSIKAGVAAKRSFSDRIKSWFKK